MDPSRAHAIGLSSSVVGPPLLIFASDVAAAAGYNQWRTVNDLESQYAARGFDAGIDARTESEALAESAMEKISASPLATEVYASLARAPAPESVEQLRGVDALVDVAVSQMQSSVSAHQTTALTDAETAALKKELVSAANRDFGTRKESVALDLYERETGRRVYGGNEKCYYMTVGCRDSESVREEDSRLFTICGRVDGLCDTEDGVRIVEVKNRKHRFFDRPPMYDLVQMLVYWRLLESNGIRVAGVDLVECLAHADGPRIQVQAIDRDDLLWQGVMERLDAFANNVYAIRKCMV